MNIRVQLQDGTDAPFKTEIVDGSLVVTVVSKEEKKDLFPKWDELGYVGGYWTTGACIRDIDSTSTEWESNSNLFTTSDLAKASLATARVSQTYKRYRELVINLPTYIIWQVEATVIREFGLLRMAFANSSDWERFYESNKEDLDLITKVTLDIQI